MLRLRRVEMELVWVQGRVSDATGQVKVDQVTRFRVRQGKGKCLCQGNNDERRQENKLPERKL